MWRFSRIRCGRVVEWQALADVLVPEGAVHELLGVKRAPRQVGVHVSILNAMGRRWLDREDVLRWLQVNANHLSLPLLMKLYDELADITAKGD